MWAIKMLDKVFSPDAFTYAFAFNLTDAITMAECFEACKSVFPPDRFSFTIDPDGYDE